MKSYYKCKEDFPEEYIKNVLLGNKTEEILLHKHDKLELFGCYANEEDPSDLAAIIRQALIAGYLKKNVDNFGILKVTPEGKKFFEHPQSFKIAPDREFDDDEQDLSLESGATCAVDPALYQILKDLRKRLAKELDIPPYVIFQDSSLNPWLPFTLKQ